MSIAKLTDYDKFNRLMLDVIEKELSIGITKALEDDTIIVAISTNNREIIRSRTYNLTDTSLSDIIGGMNTLRGEIIHVKKNRYQNQARTTSKVSVSGNGGYTPNF